MHNLLWAATWFVLPIFPHTIVYQSDFRSTEGLTLLERATVVRDSQHDVIRVVPNRAPEHLQPVGAMYVAQSLATAVDHWLAAFTFRIHAHTCCNGADGMAFVITPSLSKSVDARCASVFDPVPFLFLRSMQACCCMVSMEIRDLTLHATATFSETKHPLYARSWRNFWL